MDKEEEGKFLLSGLEKKKIRKDDGSNDEEKVFMFNLF